MILVDRSVWVLLLRGQESEAVRRLRHLSGQELLLVGDLVLVEVLQGARDEAHAVRREEQLRRFPIVPLLSDDLAVKAARNYRRLRALGATMRRTIDVIIGTWCIEHDHALLHEAPDYLPMQQHLGLKAA